MKENSFYSASLESAVGRFSPQERITAWALVSEILRAHPEYGNHIGGKLTSSEGPPQGDLRTVGEWLNGLTRLFNMDRVQKEVEVLDGRMAIWGLAQLDPVLKSYLDSFDLLSAISDEFKTEKHIPPGELVQRSVRTDQIFAPNQEIPYDPSQEFERVRALSDEFEKSKALGELLRNAPENIRSEMAHDALAVAREFSNPSSRIDAIVQVLPFLSADVRVDAAREAFAAASMIEDPSTRLYSLRVILDGLPEESHPEVAREAVAIALQVEDPYTRVMTLFQLLPDLPEDYRPEVASEMEKAAGEIEDPAKRKDARAVILNLPRRVKPRKRSPIQPVSSYFPPVAGYISDRADEQAADLLNIEREVANISNVLTYKQVQPPLALGLFGDWGSGKTFFIGKLRSQVNRIAEYYQREEQRSGAEALWCSRVAQIDFNAWHFSDSNLWASLVTRIYEGLDRELNKEKEIADDIKKKIIEAQIKEAKEKSIKAESQLDLATTRVDTAQQNFAEKRKEREAKENKLQGLIASVPDLLEGTAFKKPLVEAAAMLGVPEAAKAYDSLEALGDELKSLSGRSRAVTARLLYSPWALVGMAFFILLVPLLLTFAIEEWGTWFSEAGKRVAEISSFIMILAGWLQVQARRGLKVVATVEDALQKAREIRQKRIEEDPQVLAAQKELNQAQAEEQAARTNLESAKTELQRLQDELQELRPERKLQRLIEMRASTGAYAQHLGIISLIRADFENMSNILADMVREREDFTKAPPIQRIILYIDDLDRCRPERVVEVLEAVHLLLYFPLFVVVVAVDPRWLRHSLRQHYPATLRESGGRLLMDKDSTTSLFSTPQDYLEKIFQIPFALRPVERGGYQNLVNDLLKPLPARERKKVNPTQEIIPEIETPSAGGGKISKKDIKPDADQTVKIPESKFLPEEKKVEEKPYTPIPSRQLEFTKWEQEDIQKLWLMFRTPRTVKRFINIYRLLRAGLNSDEEVRAFEGSRKNPGDYQVVLLLLAALTAFPNESSKLLYRLDAWLDSQELKNRRSAVTWREVLGFLRNESKAARDQNPARTNGRKKRIGEQRLSQGFPAESMAREDIDDVEDESGWLAMLDGLERITQDDRIKKSFKLVTLRTWTMRVARFSFSVQPT